MKDDDVPAILRTASRVEARRYPWFDGTLGSCIALRMNRAAFAVLMLPAIVLDLVKIPGTGILVRRICPLGQLAFSRTRASLGFPYTKIAAACVDVDWVEDVRSVEVVRTGWLFAELRVNERTVRVDRRCAPALVELWASE